MHAFFLGTGGGRFCMIRQLRKTGGVFFDLDGFKMLVDPGPGSLVYSLQNNIPLQKLDVLLVTHAHTDHCNDAEVIIEGMTSGCTKKRGILISNSTVLHGASSKTENFTQKISLYHKNCLEKIIEPSENKEINIQGIKFKFIKTKHADPNTLAFRLKKGNLNMGYITDTVYFENLAEFFKGCNILFVNLLRPRYKPWKGHLNTEDVLTLLNKIRPKKVILHHFGVAMLYGSIKKEKVFLKNNIKFDCEIIFAKDFQTVSLNNEKEKIKNLSRFLK